MPNACRLIECDIIIIQITGYNVVLLLAFMPVVSCESSEFILNARLSNEHLGCSTCTEYNHTCAMSKEVCRRMQEQAFAAICDLCDCA